MARDFQPPHSIEAEQAVLGGLLLVPSSWDLVADRLGEQDFYRRDHRAIFRAIVELEGRGQPFDPITLGEWLESAGEAEELGGAAYLTELANTTPGAANIGAYADIVRERSILRQLIDVSHDIAEKAFHTGGQPSAEILDRAEQQVLAIRELNGRADRAFETSTEVLRKTIERIEFLTESPGAVVGLESGFVDLDRMTAGFQPGDLVLIAGRPSMGKTTFALNVADSAIRNRRVVGVFSMEMQSEALMMRMLAARAQIDHQHIRTGQLAEDEWSRLSSAMNEFRDAPIHFDQTRALSPLELRSRARRLKRERGALDLVVIDYLQLMQVPNTKENRATEVSEISRALKALAGELGCPVLALSQLNRGLEQRPNKRPIMADLRESGSLEQDADLILFVYRDEVYNPQSPDRGKAELIIGKQRNGETGTVPLAFRGQFARFDNYTR